MPLARLDASGDRTDQGGLGTQDDQAPPTIKTEAAHAGQTGATGPNHSKPAANDAESLYWASLNQQAEQKAQALAIEGWGTGTDGPARQTAQAKIAEVYYFHTDQVGLPEELSNSQGQLVWQATYKTWGNTRAEEWKLVEADGGRVHSLDAGDQPENEARQQNLRFQGQYLDRDTGLHYNTFRFFDPDIGRFISPDPIGLEGGINLGSYSPNPISWIDPWGWSCQRPGGYKKHDADAHGNLSPHANRAPGHTNTKADNRVQSHHAIQQEWAKRQSFPNGAYDPSKAPAVLLPSNSGASHAKISAAQRAFRRQNGYGTTARQEFNEAARQMRAAGVPEKVVRQTLRQNYKYFDELGAF